MNAISPVSFHGPPNRVGIGGDQRHWAERVQHGQYVFRVRAWRYLVQQGGGQFTQRLGGTKRLAGEGLTDELLSDALFAWAGGIVSVDQHIGIEKLRSGHAGLPASTCVRPRGTSTARSYAP